jgi:hypothetical protein
MNGILLALGLVLGVQAFGQQTATVHVYRAQAHLKGIMLHPSVYCDGKEITRLHKGTFFAGLSEGPKCHRAIRP